MGAVDGGDHPADVVEDVSGIMIQGGTVIGIARCAAFRRLRSPPWCRDYPRRHRPAVVIGGDGSLTGTDVLRDEWPGHIELLLAEGPDQRRRGGLAPSLMVVGWPA